MNYYRKTDSKIKYHYLHHILFWVISVALFIVVLFYIRGDFSLATLDLGTIASILITVVLLAVSVYINLQWLIPKFFNRRRFWQFSLLETGNIALFILLNFSVSFLFEEGPHPNIIAEVIAEFILVFIFLVVSTLLKVMRDSITLQDIELKMKEIEKRKVEAELKALKAQVNPHFFFNTLNSLYSLSLDKSDKAPELILKLSELMRYVIYESKDDLVTMEKQIDFLQSYVYLERLRSPDYVRIDFIVNGGNRDVEVAPLLFVAFVENAFKHGSKDRALNPFIRVGLNLSRKERIVFYCENTVDPGYVSKKRGGVGLANVRQQLELMYPGKYDLKIDDTQNCYKVELTIFVV